MTDLVERLRIAAKIHRDMSGQSAIASTIEEAADALEAARADGLRLDWMGSGEDRTCYVGMDDRWTVQDGPLMVGGDTLRAAIDQARAADGCA